MALVSPGIQISINDQSQYVNSNVGSVPLVVLATAQDKTYNGAVATGTSKTNAGKLQSFTSQRDLVTAMGTPMFQTSSAGTPLHGNELNEYGLLTAYSALGLGNQLYAIRADIDLGQLEGTSVRPVMPPANDTYWLDTVNTEWGIYRKTVNTAGDEIFSHVDPIVVTDSTQVEDLPAGLLSSVPFPVKSIGTMGSYALVTTDTTGAEPAKPDYIRLFYKGNIDSYADLVNEWVLVGSTDWQKTHPVVTSTDTFTVTPGVTTITINSITITADVSVDDISKFVNQINDGPAVTGVYAGYTSTGLLELYVTDDAVGSTAIISDASTVNISSGTYNAPILFYGTYAQAPLGGWYGGGVDTTPRPAGSIWWKTTATGGGWNPVIKEYNTALGMWETMPTPFYHTAADSIYALDPTGGGINISHEQLVALWNVVDGTSNSLVFKRQETSAATVARGGAIDLTGGDPFNSGDQFSIATTVPGQQNLSSTYIITLSGSTGQTFVADVLGANIPYMSASYEEVGGYGYISIINSTGGQFIMNDTSGSALTDAGFVDGEGSGFVVNVATGSVTGTNWQSISSIINYQASAPYASPDNGTYWYYSNPTDVDIMIQDGGAWKGYRRVSNDSRGFDLRNTDPYGVIFSAGIAPTSQSDGTVLVSGDLWLDTSDLVNYPKLYRYNATSGKWTAIDNTDHITSNGIIFADARWDGNSDDTGGTTDIISGSLPAVKDLLVSNYTDVDAPNPALYPRGTLMFNTRRSGYNVKKFVKEYFNADSFATYTDVAKDGWVTASGLDGNGVMHSGSRAQRNLVVEALRSAIDSNLEVREDVYGFNLLVCPGYPEVISNLVNLNNDRANTGFIIGDAPLTLAPNAVTISNWVDNTDGNGLPSVAASDTYTGIYYPAGLTNDLAGNTVAVPASHAALHTFLYNDNVSYPWFAPAGVHRGLVSNLNDIGYVDASTGRFVHNAVTQGLRDALYTLKINPITQLPGVGIVVWGQETRSGSSSSRDRVNVVRLENYLRRVFKGIANGYLFEPNDSVTRTGIARQIEGALHDVLSKRGIYDFLVICDTSNNTPSTIANNQLYVDVAIEPMRDVEFIYIPIALYNPGAISTLQASST